MSSVNGQTFSDWEHIIVNDGSTDDSGEIISSMLEDPRVRLLSKPNGGVSRARNLGFEHSSAESEYVMFLDSDDRLDPTMLETMIDYLDRNPDVGLAYCGFVWIDESGRVFTDGAEARRLVPCLGLARELPTSARETPFVAVYAAGGLVPTMSTVFRRSAFMETGGFDETFGQGYEDSDVVLRACLRHRMHFVELRLYCYRRCSGQSSSDSERLGRQRGKLYAKWQSSLDFSESERELVRSAEDFRLGPFQAYQYLSSARKSWKDGKPSLAFGAVARAARRILRWRTCRLWARLALRRNSRWLVSSLSIGAIFYDLLRQT